MQPLATARFTESSLHKTGKISSRAMGGCNRCLKINPVNTCNATWYTCATGVGTGIVSLPHISEKNNFIFLTVGLVLLLFIGSVLEYIPGDYGPRIVQAATISFIMITALGQKGQHTRLVINIIFVLVMTLVVVAGAVLDNAGFSYAHLILLLCFFIWMTKLLLYQVLFTGAVDGNKIIGAICIYMLLAMIWAMLYLLIAQALPGSFNGVPQAPWLENFSTATYFSFVTITTLGYGDILPISPLARFLVTMEAIVGVFYMAIVVASLIGVRLSSAGAAHD
jgi:voltage-gated potassium channel Kch